MPRKKKQPIANERLKPISFYPQTPEEALQAIMTVDPKKVDERLREKGIKRK
jgi:hypothetical protein